MPASRPHRQSGVAARLRAAGCVFAEDEARLLVAAARTPAELAALVDRRVAGRPLEHVLGWAEFCGVRVAVDPAVFVPRRRTELLVRQAAAVTRPGAVVVELCCGSGAVGAALAARERIELYAVDLDTAAVRCARRNLAGAGGRVWQGDLYRPLPGRLRGRVAVLLANAPYVPTGSVGLLPAEARLHEPRRALDGGPDGLDVLRRVVAGAPDWLAPGGHLLMETSEPQAPQLVAELTRHGLAGRIASDGERGATAVIATAAGPPR